MMTTKEPSELEPIVCSQCGVTMEPELSPTVHSPGQVVEGKPVCADCLAKGDETASVG